MGKEGPDPKLEVSGNGNFRNNIRQNGKLS